MEKLDAEVRRELVRFKPAEGDITAVARVWASAVGESVARNAWPARFGRDGVLHVNTVSSTWAFELGRLADTILAQLRPELGKATPPALKFAAGPVPEAAAVGAERRAGARLEVEPGDRAEGAALAAGIEDDELRGLVARAAAASLAGARREAPADRRF
ncbi:MAG: DciA family protein [Gaiellaceae bacterium]